MAIGRLRRIAITGIVSLLFYLFVAYVLDSIWTVLRDNKLNTPLRIQSIAYARMRALDEIPTRLDQLPVSPETLELFRSDIHEYDPNSYKMPGQVLLLYRNYPWIWVTFGDGSQGVMARYRQAIHPTNANDLSLKYRTVTSEYAGPDEFGKTCVFGIIAIAICLIVASFFRNERIKSAQRILDSVESK